MELSLIMFLSLVIIWMSFFPGKYYGKYIQEIEREFKEKDRTRIGSLEVKIEELENKQKQNEILYRKQRTGKNIKSRNKI